MSIHGILDIACGKEPEEWTWFKGLGCLLKVLLTIIGIPIALYYLAKWLDPFAT